MTLATAVGFTDESISIFLATDLRATQVHADGIEEESMTIERIAFADVDELIEALSVRIDPDRIIDAPLGPVIGTHTGPDTLGVAYRVA